MSLYYKFPCGCKYKVLEESKDPNILPLLDFDVNNIYMDCKATWDLLGRGLTKGVFQLESNLGKHWTKRLKPENLEHLAALGAILRPGVLRSIDEQNQCSLTELYCRRRHREVDIDYIDECLVSVLEPTFGVLTYQEQAMRIAELVALFTLQEADELRKAIGKKLAEEMAKVKIKYFEGARKAKVVSEEVAAEIFSWIEKSQRYSFNKSHALSYGINGYISAYLKAHFPLHFYTSWLYYAKDKSDPQQEVKELVNDAKLLDVEVLPPNIVNKETHFSNNGKEITFGLSDIKGIGEAQVDKLNKAVDEACKLLGKDIINFTWYEILVHLTPLLSTTIVTRLISVGAFRDFNGNRNKMLDEYAKWNDLTKTEQAWVQTRSLNQYAKNTYAFDTPKEVDLFSAVEKIDSTQSLPAYNNLLQALKALAPTRKEGGGTANVKRSATVASIASLIEKPPVELKDTPNWIAWTEENLLGVPLTCSVVDGCDTTDSNCTCKEYLAGREGYLVFAVKIDSLRVITTKNGKSAGSKMAFITVSDSTCAIEMIVFPKAWEDYSPLIAEGNTVLIQAKRDNKKESLIVEKMYQL